MKKLSPLVKGLFRISVLGPFFLSIAFAQDPMTSSIKQENAPYNEALKTMQTKAEQQMLTKTQTASTAQGQEKTTASVMIVDPLVRASDFKEAFGYLSQYKAGTPLYFELDNKEKMYGVADLSIMKGGSLVIFKMNSTTGQKYRVIKTENIVSIGTD